MNQQHYVILVQTWFGQKIILHCIYFEVVCVRV
jgi:hypothetical protein